MNPDDTPAREPSLIDIEVLDLGPLYEQAVDYFISLDSSRRSWPEERRRRLIIRTECRWGRVLFEPAELYVVSEKGEGPRAPLGKNVRAYIALYAELAPTAGDAGFFESTPFCKVPIDDHAARAFRALGIVALEDFIRVKIPEMEAAYAEWLAVLRAAQERAHAHRANRVIQKVGA